MRAFVLLSVFFVFVACSKKQRGGADVTDTFIGLFQKDQTLQLVFAGDAMMHITQLNRAFKDSHYRYDSYFSLLQPLLDSADIAVVNLETTLAASNYTGYPVFASPDAYAYSLKEAGFNVFLLANNHCLDRGRRGVERTISVLDSINVRRVGVYKDADDRALNDPMLIDKKGMRVAFLNYTYGINGLIPQFPTIVNQIDTMLMLADIQRCIDLKAHFIVAALHWGDEYTTKPNRAQQIVKDFLFAKGVDLIVGSHPHVVQPLQSEQTQEGTTRWVAYSLGNLISNMDRSLTDGGMLLKVNIRRAYNQEKAYIDSVGYSLLYVHKSPVYESGYQLVPVEQMLADPEREQKMDEYSYQKMLSFHTLAKNAIEGK